MIRSRCRQGRAALALAAALAAACAQATALRPGLNSHVQFQGYSPLAKTRELFFRELNPLGERRALARYAQRGQPVPEFTVDLAVERFAVYVPSTPPPPRGYGLLVFIPPWQQAVVPQRWRSALEETGTIFVTAARSGNDEVELPRRMALALHGYANLAAQFRIDPERVYVGGFSGGARIAERLALGYSDVFRGAILDGSSDTIGTPLAPLPPPELLHRAQQQLRLVYLYGSKDSANEEIARYSMQSARTWCLPELERIVMVDHGHAPADGVTFLRALRLQEAAHAPVPTLAECRAHHEAQRKADVARVDALRAAGSREAAIAALQALDARWAQYAGADIQRIADALGY